MSFDRKLNEFVIIANRFCWELEPLSMSKAVMESRFMNALCGIRIAHVRSVQHITGLNRVNMGYLTCLRLALWIWQKRLEMCRAAIRVFGRLKPSIEC